MIRKYDNQVEIDELQQKLFEISPDLKLCEFNLRDNVAIRAILRIPEKGNKKVIDSLIALGFYKVCRGKMKTYDGWTLYEGYSMIVVLEKPLRGGI